MINETRPLFSSVIDFNSDILCCVGGYTCSGSAIDQCCVLSVSTGNIEWITGQETWGSSLLPLLL